jgi:hypothetical protein
MTNMHYGKDSLFPASKTKKRRFFARNSSIPPIFARFRRTRSETHHPGRKCAHLPTSFAIIRPSFLV